MVMQVKSSLSVDSQHLTPAKKVFGKNRPSLSSVKSSFLLWHPLPTKYLSTTKMNKISIQCRKGIKASSLSNNYAMINNVV